MWLPHYNGTCRWGIRTPQGSDWISTRWTNDQPSKPKWTCPWNRTMNPGSQGTEPSCSSEITISTYPKALDDTHCCQCCHDAQLHPNKRSNFWHSQPKDHHVWRDSQLQETLESPSWTILSGAAHGRYPAQWSKSKN
jgi:hypothetical protein